MRLCARSCSKRGISINSRAVLQCPEFLTFNISTLESECVELSPTSAVIRSICFNSPGFRLPQKISFTEEIRNGTEQPETISLQSQQK